MKRRAVVFALLAAGGLLADDRSDALDSVASLASALANSGNQIGVTLPANLPDDPALRANIEALIAEAEVSSSIDVIQVANGAADLDWLMTIRNRQSGLVVERRRGTVKIRFRKRRLLALEPASFFAPPKQTK